MTSQQILFQHVLATAAEVPTAKRACLYRALADFAGDPRQTDDLLLLADELETAEQRCREFQFQFSNRAARGARPSTGPGPTTPSP